MKKLLVPNSKLAKKEPESKVPTDLKKALATTQKVEALWKDLTPIARRDFITWIEGAKQPETRMRRIGITRNKLIKGDRHPCCYAVVPMNFYKALGANPRAKTVWSSLTPTERRDFVGWIAESKDSKTRTERIEKVCSILTVGKRKL